MKHTPAPWHVAQFIPESVYPGADAIGGGIIARCYSKHRSREEQAANASRIVACVNALEGIISPADFMAELRADGNEQREVLAAALRKFLTNPTVAAATYSTDMGLCDCVTAGRAALAKVSP